MQQREDAIMAAIHGLKKINNKKLKPLEKCSLFEYFYGPALTDLDFECKPQVLLVGENSTGKTSFIKYLLGRDFPGQHLRCELSTEKFVAVVDGDFDCVISGHALCSSSTHPYQELSQFGPSFLNNFEGSQLPSKVLKNMTLIDTPGISNDGDIDNFRGYDYLKVLTWFAKRVDLILLLFDAQNLFFSKQLCMVLEKFQLYGDKVRFVLNKADALNQQTLLQAYDQLMSNINKIIHTPSKQRVYVGSFWDQSHFYMENSTLLDMEERDFMKDLRDLPRNCMARKISNFMKRCKLARTHAHLMSYIRHQMPLIIGKEKAKRMLMQNLPQVYRIVRESHNLNPADFPDIEMFRSKCETLDFSKLPKPSSRMIQGINNVLSKNIAHYLDSIAPTSMRAVVDSEPSFRVTTLRSFRDSSSVSLSGSSLPTKKLRRTSLRDDERLSSTEIDMTPLRKCGQADIADKFSSICKIKWDLEKEAEQNLDEFMNLKPVRGVLLHSVANARLLETYLPPNLLSVVWDLCDLDKDGGLDHEEFTLALHLCQLAKSGASLPESLPITLIPISKRIVTPAM